MKIEEVKIAQSERKTSALQDMLHSNEEVIKKLEEKLSSAEQVIQNCNNNLRKREDQITFLKDQTDDFQGKLREADIRVGDLESDNERLIKENELVMSQRDDAITALDKRDEQILELTRKVEQERARNKQLDANLSALSKQLAASSAQLAELQDNAAQGVGDHKGLDGAAGGAVAGKQFAHRADAAPRVLGPGQLPLVQHPHMVHTVVKGKLGVRRDLIAALEPNLVAFVLDGDDGDRDAGNEVGVAAKPEAAAGDGQHSNAAAEDKDGAAVNVLPAPVAGEGIPVKRSQQSAVLPAPGRDRNSRSSPAPSPASSSAAQILPAAHESPSLRRPSSKAPLGSIHLDVMKPSVNFQLMEPDRARDNVRELSGNTKLGELGGNFRIKVPSGKVHQLSPFYSDQLSLRQSPDIVNEIDAAQLHHMNRLIKGERSPNTGFLKEELGFAREPMDFNVPVEHRVYLENHGPLKKRSSFNNHIPEENNVPQKNYIHLGNHVLRNNNNNNVPLENSIPERYNDNSQLASGLRPPVYEPPFVKTHFEPLQAYDHRPPPQPDDDDDEENRQQLEELQKIQRQQQEEYEKHQKLQRAGAGNPLPGDVIDLSLYHNRADYPELRQAVSLLRGDRQGRAADSPDHLQQPEFPVFGAMDGPPHQPPNDVIPPPPDFNVFIYRHHHNPPLFRHTTVACFLNHALLHFSTMLFSISPPCSSPFLHHALLHFSTMLFSISPPCSSPFLHHARLYFSTMLVSISPPCSSPFLHHARLHFSTMLVSISPPCSSPLLH
ncbi:hypothetical protein FHG87_012578 [Trinorchestia longiramus]|nr:hypothetical protein FHG87_012578 [Trinorchestia longiramus]